MDTTKLTCLGVAGVMLASYNLSQPDLIRMRQNSNIYPHTGNVREAYGADLVWLDRLSRGDQEAGGIGVDPKTGELYNLKPGDVSDSTNVKLDFSVLSSLMVAGLASGFKSQVANLLWMKSDEYWHQGLFTRQVPLMEAVVTLDPKFVDAWSTAGWHWAYNIYADIPTNPAYKAKGEKYIARLQNNAVATGLGYLKRGANANPDTYRLWFEWGWTRAEKAGFYDDNTLNLYEIARTKSDARTTQRTKVVNGKAVTYYVQGMDLMGRTIGHLYERIPEFQKAEDHYFSMMQGTPANRALLDAVGYYWHIYGSHYDDIVRFYKSADEPTKAQIRKLIPDVDHMVAADDMRRKIAGLPDLNLDQPVGAYVTIQARYMPAWQMLQNKDYEGAIAEMVGVMNANPHYCLTGLPVLAQVLALRGDDPAAIDKEMKDYRDTERDSSQELGLHFLAKIYEAAEADATAKGNAALAAKYRYDAYETWYRSRSRNALDFYALRESRWYQDHFNYATPDAIVAAIKASRTGGVPNAAPEVPPDVADYYKS